MTWASKPLSWYPSRSIAWMTLGTISTSYLVYIRIQWTTHEQSKVCHLFLIIDRPQHRSRVSKLWSCHIVSHRRSSHFLDSWMYKKTRGTQNFRFLDSNIPVLHLEEIRNIHKRLTVNHIHILQHRNCSQCSNCDDPFWCGRRPNYWVMGLE